MYFAEFRVLSVVGPLVSFEDRVEFQCDRAAGTGTVRLTTLDLSGSRTQKPGERSDQDHIGSGKSVSLIEYFDESLVLDAVVADPMMGEALRLVGATRPRTINELVGAFEKSNYHIPGTDFGLAPDFLTRFAFHRVEGEKVAVRIGLPPHFGFNEAEHGHIDLLLPVPEPLRRDLSLAASQEQGFLMERSEEIAGDRMTVYEFRTGE